MSNLSLFPDAIERKRKRSPKPESKNGFVSSLWSFQEANEPLPYRWYGTLPTALVERVTQMYSTQGDRVLDAFAGSGTFVRVAAGAGRRAVGVDVNPLACLMADARMESIPTESAVMRAVHSVTNWSAKARIAGYGLLPKATAEALNAEGLAYTRKWIRPDTLSAFMHLIIRIAEVDDLRLQRAFLLAAAQVIRNVANVDPRCTHHLVTKKKEFIDPAEAWAALVPTVLDCLAVPRVPKKNAEIRQGSVLTTPFRKSSFNLVLAHPPYLGVIHYHLIHRLATDLLGVVQDSHSPTSLKRYDFSHEEIRSHDVSTDATKPYRLFLQSFAEQARDLVCDHGRCVVILGDQRHKGHLRHPFTDCIAEMTSNGFLVEELFIWELHNNGGMHVLRRGNFIDHNYVIVFHKMGA